MIQDVFRNWIIQDQDQTLSRKGSATKVPNFFIKNHQCDQHLQSKVSKGVLIVQN